MVRTIITFLFLISFWSSIRMRSAERIIRIGTNSTDLIFKVGKNGRLYQSYLGQKLQNESEFGYLKQGREAYLTHGMEDYFEPAIRVLHNDGNPSLLLKFVSSEVNRKSDNVTETVILLKDDKYPVEVKLFFTAFAEENVIKTHAEISHQEKKPVVLYNYASSLLHLNAAKYWLTEFSGNWAHEVNMTERQLDFGKKIVDTKLGSRANLFCSPYFMISLNAPVQEDAGEVLLGTVSWTGNFPVYF